MYTLSIIIDILIIENIIHGNDQMSHTPYHKHNNKDTMTYWNTNLKIKIYP